MRLQYDEIRNALWHRVKSGLFVTLSLARKDHMISKWEVKSSELMMKYTMILNIAQTK